MRCDIIIPTWNALGYTRDCLESIFANTDYPYKVIVVDNASDNQTKEYLKSLKKQGKISLIRNEDNSGFVKAVNQGLQFSNAPFMCVLNNDTLVAKGWLKEVITIFKEDSNIGLVNPSSNNLGIDVPRGVSMDEFARSLLKHTSQFTELGAVIGFCLFVRREVIDKIGYLDEIYGMGNFEDTDYSRRAFQAGFRCVMAKAAYVHHKGSSSFKKIKSFDKDFKKNMKIFYDRWGKPKRILYILNGKLGETFLKEIYRLVSLGDWVHIFSKKEPESLIEHGNIRFIRLEHFFYLMCLLKIIIKKKKFDEIYVRDRKLANILNSLSPIHRGKVIVI